jgi:GrpB-like predicted nucleotidyltransferase (UPF0157 family)
MKKYVFKPYSNKFPKLFEMEKQRLLAEIKNQVLIEHVGSTAVPGLGGKGIIDIAIGAKKSEFEELTAKLQALGYEFRPHFSTPDRLYFIIFLPDEDEGTRRYHLHLMAPECTEWKEMLYFRDYLKAHPEEAKHYADLKKNASEEVNEEGEKYRALKAPFFKKILKF